MPPDSLFEASDVGSSPSASSQISSCPKTVTFRLNNAVVRQFDLPCSPGSASSSPSQHIDDDSLSSSFSEEDENEVKYSPYFSGILSDNDPRIAHGSTPGTLPPFVEAPDPSGSTWGERDGADLAADFRKAYDTVHRMGLRLNAMDLPNGGLGKRIVQEYERLIAAANHASPLGNFSLLALSLIPILLLQKPFARSKPPVDRKCLARRLRSWEKGHIEDLLEEAVEIQKRLDSSRKAPSKESVTRMFTRWVIDGQSRRALRLLSDNSKGDTSIDRRNNCSNP
jgi:hypothetical protein